MDNILFKVKDLLSDLNIDYAFSGGFALDLFIGKTIRKHSDIDICVFLNDRNKIIDYMILKGWKVYEFCGNGIIHFLDNYTMSIHKSNLMCIYNNCELLEIKETGNINYFYHNFYDVGITKLNYMEFLFNDKLENIIIFDKKWDITKRIEEAFFEKNGLKYLAPEIIMYFKSYNLDNKNQMDYDKIVDHLNINQIKWLNESLVKKYGDNHI
jgi:hypothetical protein